MATTVQSEDRTTTVQSQSNQTLIHRLAPLWFEIFCLKSVTIVSSTYGDDLRLIVLFQEGEMLGGKWPISCGIWNRPSRYCSRPESDRASASDALAGEVDACFFAGAGRFPPPPSLLPFLLLTLGIMNDNVSQPSQMPGVELWTAVEAIETNAFSFNDSSKVVMTFCVGARCWHCATKYRLCRICDEQQCADSRIRIFN